jgi:hypothetical protein
LPDTISTFSAGAIPRAVTVPTVDRGFLLVVFCPVEMAGERPSMESTSGFCIIPRNCRAYEERDSGVPALAFCIVGIERSCRFAGAGDAGYDDELVPGDRDADIFEVVLAGTFDDDIFHVRVLRLFSSGI